MKYSLLALLALGFIASPAFAAHHETDWTPCKADIEKYCKAAEGEEKIAACLKEREKEISKACEAVVEEHGKHK